MTTEFETKILDIDVEKIMQKLEQLGARRIIERNMKRYVYDFTPKKKHSWIRLRFDGEKTKLAVKEIQNDQIDGTKEIEIEVDDFDKTHLLLHSIGYVHKAYQENKRISYMLDDVEIEIDFWPHIPPYLEIEGKSVKDVEQMVQKLGFEMSQTTTMNTKKVYEKHGIDVFSFNELKFEE
jgi:adenylate cyclase, class 2